MNDYRKNYGFGGISAVEDLQASIRTIQNKYLHYYSIEIYLNKSLKE